MLEHDDDHECFAYEDMTDEEERFMKPDSNKINIVGSKSGNLEWILPETGIIKEFQPIWGTRTFDWLLLLSLLHSPFANDNPVTFDWLSSLFSKSNCIPRQIPNIKQPFSAELIISSQLLLLSNKNRPIT